MRSVHIVVSLNAEYRENISENFDIAVPEKMAAPSLAQI